MVKGGDKMYEVKDVAKELHLSYRGVLNMIKQGRIRAVKVGKKYLVSEEEIVKIKRKGS